MSESGKVIHKMRLRGHWEVSRTAEGLTRHARRFGRPRTLDPNEAIHVACASIPEAATVYVNEKPLGDVQSGESFTFDISALIDIRNTLTIEFRGPYSETKEVGETTIEIIAR